MSEEDIGTLSIEKVQEISSLVEKEIETMANEEIKAIELKLSECVSKQQNGEPWICHVERNSNNLEWYEKPLMYHLNKKKLDQMKKLLNDQAIGTQKMSVASPNFKIFLVQSQLKIDNEVKYLVQRYYDRLSKFSEPKSSNKESQNSYLDKLSYLEISVVAQYLDDQEVGHFRRISKTCNFAACYAIIQNIQIFSRLLSTEDYLKNQEWLKENMPKNVDELISFNARFEDKNMSEFTNRLSSESVKETLHLVMRLAQPHNKKVKFDATDFRRVLLTSRSDTNDLLNKVDYSKISSQIFREVLKRKKLWNVGEVSVGLSEKFNQFYKFIDNSLIFLAIRERPELFQNMNEFYNLILKSVYLISLSHKVRLLDSHIAHIKNMNGGRIDALMPSKAVVFKGVSLNVLSNLVSFFELKDGFKKFRLLGKKFNQCFEQYLLLRAVDIDKKLKGYSSAAIEEAKVEIKNNLTVVERINQQGTQINHINGEAKNITEKKLYHALSILTKSEPLKRVKVKCDEKGQPNFKTGSDSFNHANFRNINQVKPYWIKEFKRFVDFFGPNEEEIKEYMMTNRIKEDLKIKYLQDVIQYWFVERNKLKDRSTLHNLLLNKEEQQEEITKLMAFYKKFKPNKLKEEGFE